MEKNEQERVLIFQMYSNFIQSIKHFDIMQTFYRLMASTFLLGSFGAIGFLFSTQNKNLSYENIFPVILICCIGMASILSLWHLDLIFCERLLISNFAEAIKLEEKNDWLPKVHHNMLYGIHSQDKPSNVLYFYIGSGSSLLLTTGVVVITSMSYHDLWARSVVLIITFVLILMLYFYLKSRTKKIKDLLKRIDKN